jgi:hypothetical protein
MSSIELIRGLRSLQVIIRADLLDSKLPLEIDRGLLSFPVPSAAVLIFVLVAGPPRRARSRSVAFWHGSSLSKERPSRFPEARKSPG